MTNKRGGTNGYSSGVSRLTKQDYQSALDVQGAVNLSGAVITFHAIMDRINRESNAIERSGLPHDGLQWKNHHPIVTLFAATIFSLNSGWTGTTGLVVKATDFCIRAATGKHAHLAITVGRGEVVEYEAIGFGEQGHE